MQKKHNSLKQYVCTGDMVSITQRKQHKSKRCYYLGARRHYGGVLPK